MVARDKYLAYSSLVTEKKFCLTYSRRRPAILVEDNISVINLS